MYHTLPVFCIFGRGGGGELYLLKVQACPERDRRPATRSKVSGQYLDRGRWGGELFTCPYPLMVQACPLLDRTPAIRSKVSGQGGVL